LVIGTSFVYGNRELLSGTGTAVAKGFINDIGFSPE